MLIRLCSRYVYLRLEIIKMRRYSFEEIIKCEMCGDSTKTHFVLGQRLDRSQGLSPKNKTGISVSVQKCNKCDLIYAQPLPIPFDINDHYGMPPENYWKEDYFIWTPDYFFEQIKVIKTLLPFKDRMVALDIGAGIGKSMISLMNAGFDTYGFEPSVPFYERALSKMNIDPAKLKNGKIEDIGYSENMFDFITFGAVFEHIYHPASALEKAMIWLKPNGVIQVEVPSSKHLIGKIINFYYKLRGTNYVTNISPMHSPFHLYEFDLKSFKALGKKLGFAVEQYQYDVCEIAFVPKILRPIFRQYMKWTNTGMQLTVYLRKK
jgi:ubiquinone/menaquinone biosynthesis C-methylase UbiE/rRNA maturation protein Nop10